MHRSFCLTVAVMVVLGVTPVLAAPSAVANSTAPAGGATPATVGDSKPAAGAVNNSSNSTNARGMREKSQVGASGSAWRRR